MLLVIVLVDPESVPPLFTVIFPPEMAELLLISNTPVLLIVTFPLEMAELLVMFNVPPLMVVPPLLEIDPDKFKLPALTVVAPV